MKVIVRSALPISLFFSVVSLAGCSHGGAAGSGSPNGGGNGNGGGSVGVTDGGSDASTATPSGPVDMAPELLDVEPSTLQTLTISAGQPMPTMQFAATYGGGSVNVAWSLDRGDIGSVVSGPAPTTTFTPGGSVAGLVNLSASLNGIVVKRQIMVQIASAQNGADGSNTAEAGQIAPTDPTQLNSGGGVGGVGGEGLGGAVSDPTTITALGAPSDDGSALGLAFLYPYNGTVFPRGLLAPLVMWSWSSNDADAIQLTLKNTSGSFSWSGQFARPAILASTGGAFVRHPIPQDVWQAATDSSGGADKLTLSLVVAKGGVAHGPISQTWTIAPGRVSGIIYYNSYGTNLAQNLGGALPGNRRFGGAVLSIHVGDTAPRLAAGSTTSDSTGCRVCHSVSADGSRLVVQHGENYATSSVYDLTPAGNVEHKMPYLETPATFPGLYPDGSMMMSLTSSLLSLPDDPTPLTSSGLSSFGNSLGTPAFSPDKSMLAFNPQAGSGVTSPTRKLLVSNFDASSNSFSPPVTVVDDSASSNAALKPGWPAFLPDSKSIVFHQQVAQGIDTPTTGELYTRKNAKAQIAWTNLTDATHVTTLNQLNGLDGNGNSYLPQLATASTLTCKADGTTVSTTNPKHDDDVDMNYEPTVAPIAAGGYAWVVFTSRRMYGNEATIPPYCSDPRGVDLLANITTKKLWVAAVDLNAAPGTDASHPAFYLPAQELLAGNSRGFWVLDPCRTDGTSCASGDQCCNGFCEPNGAGGALVCSNTPPVSQCSQISEKCTSASDCCDATNLCIDGFCSLAPIS